VKVNIKLRRTKAASGHLFMVSLLLGREFWAMDGRILRGNSGCEEKKPGQKEAEWLP
jgi:hypothetical protein